MLLSRLLTPPSYRPGLVFAHPDDAVLSASATLLAADGVALDVVVCGGAPATDQPSAWDAASGFGSPTEAHSTRLAEHSRVCGALGVDSVALDLPDGQHRDPAVVGPEAASIGSARLRSAVDRLASDLRRFDAGVVVTQRPDAWHPDHALAGRLATMVARRLAVPVVRVCDRPYLRCRPGACQSHPEGQPTPDERLTVTLGDDQWKAKQDLLTLYASQHRPLTNAFGPDWNTRATLGTECFATGTR